MDQMSNDDTQKLFQNDDTQKLLRPESSDENPLPDDNSTGGNVQPSPEITFDLPPLRQKGKDTTIIVSILAVLLTVSGAIFGTTAYNTNRNTLLANIQAVTQVAAAGQATATVSIHATATSVALVYPFSTDLVLNDPLSDNSRGVGWEDDGTFCSFSGNAYQVFNNQPNTYQTCAATTTNFTNFTFQVDMTIKKGVDTAGGGLIFRANKVTGQYYRLFVGADGDYGILVSVDTTGKNAHTLATGAGISSFKQGLNQTNTIAVVVRGTQISFFVNQQLISTATDNTYTHGQIGLTADDQMSNTEVAYTNAEVWQLP